MKRALLGSQLRVLERLLEDEDAYGNAHYGQSYSCALDGLAAMTQSERDDLVSRGLVEFRRGIGGSRIPALTETGREMARAEDGE